MLLELRCSGVFLQRNQSEVTLGQWVDGGLANCANDRDRTRRLNRVSQDLLMPLAIHVVQNNAANRKLRIKRPASCDEGRCGARDFGCVDHEHHRSCKAMAEGGAAVRAGAVEAVEYSPIAFDEVDAIRDRCTYKSIAHKRGAHAVAAHQVGVQIASGMRCRPTQPGGVDVVGTLLECAHLESRAAQGQQERERNEGFARAAGHTGNHQPWHGMRTGHNSVPGLGGSCTYDPPR